STELAGQPLGLVAASVLNHLLQADDVGIVAPQLRHDGLTTRPPVATEVPDVEGQDPEHASFRRSASYSAKPGTATPSTLPASSHRRTATASSQPGMDSNLPLSSGVIGPPWRRRL